MYPVAMKNYFIIPFLNLLALRYETFLWEKLTTSEIQFKRSIAFIR